MTESNIMQANTGHIIVCMAKYNTVCFKFYSHKISEKVLYMYNINKYN